MHCSPSEAIGRSSKIIAGGRIFILEGAKMIMDREELWLYSCFFHCVRKVIHSAIEWFLWVSLIGHIREGFSVSRFVFSLPRHPLLQNTFCFVCNFFEIKKKCFRIYLQGPMPGNIPLKFNNGNFYLYLIWIT